MDGVRIENKNVLRWVIKDPNSTIKMSSKYIGNVSIITVKCIILRIGILIITNNGFLNYIYIVLLYC